MKDFTLLLKSKVDSYNLALSLSAYCPQDNYSDLLLLSGSKYVCNDIQYNEALFKCDVADNIDHIEIYINDDKIGEGTELSEEGINIKLNSEQYSYYQRGMIFRDCYGFVQLFVKLIYNDNTVINLYSEYLPVYLKDTEENRSIQKMADYIYENYERYLFDYKIKPDYLTGLKENREEKSIDVAIKLLTKIINSYDKCYPFFKVNSKSRIVEAGKIDNFEKVTIITGKTLNFIAQHPDELFPVEANVGIKIRNKYFQPRKTLIINKNISYYLKENIAILGFLKHLNSEINRINKEIENRINSVSIANNSATLSGYISSIIYIYQGTITRLKAKREQLLKLQNNIVRLYYAYCTIFNFELNDSEKEIRNVPEPTAVFMEIPQYSIIFKCMYQWFRIGTFDLQKEEFILPFLVNYQLYEYYVLLKFINAIVDNQTGYKLVNSYKHTYQVSNNAKYKNTTYNNTFVFSNGEAKITLYYQPLIYGQRFNNSINNGINLYRNSTVRLAQDNEVASDGRGGNLYYTPDYLFKIQEGNFEKYVISDAKYSELNIAKNCYFSNLVFKYLFSISTTSVNNQITGLCVVCGRPGKENMLTKFDAHDITKILGFDSNHPFAHLISLFENVNQSESAHKKLLIEELLEN